MPPAVTVLSDQEVDQIIDRTNNVLLLGDGFKNTRWLNNESIIQLRKFTASYVKNKERKDGRVPECVHYIETANLAVNLARGTFLPYPKDVIAFAAYAHDILEDCGKEYPDLSAEKIVDSCWKGDAQYRQALVDTINALTDDPNITDKDVRLQTQIDIAKADATGLVDMIRYCDKLSTLMRDLSNIERGIIPFKSINKFKKYYQKRYSYVVGLATAQRFSLYDDVINMVEEVLDMREAKVQAEMKRLKTETKNPLVKIARRPAFKRLIKETYNC